LTVLSDEFEDNPRAKVIVFCQFREMAALVVDAVNSHRFPGQVQVSAERFVGQSTRPGDPGQSQPEQQDRVARFATRDFNVLVATSVAEEGLDIPSVDAVVFYEAVPSEIRLIQRRGRTGRHATGRCYILCATGTLDETYFQVSQVREHKMNDLLARPGAVETIDPLTRTGGAPVFEFDEADVLNELKMSRIQKKVRRESRSAEMIAFTAADSGEHARAARLTASGVTEVTAEINALIQARVARLERNAEHIEAMKQKMRFHRKKYFRWISDTTDACGCGGRISVIQLLEIARSEGINAYEIKREISIGQRVGTLRVEQGSVEVVAD
jgi:superfamily II DNA/RNA helicase